MCRCSVYIVFLFFFKQKTAYEMRISDWSSDVCSSDLRESLRLRQARGSHVTSTDCLALVEHPATQNRDICRDVPCLWALTRSRSGFGPFYPQRLSPPRAIGGGLERVSAIGITTVISRCRFALKRCTSCPQPASVACLASGLDRKRTRLN